MYLEERLFYEILGDRIKSERKAMSLTQKMTAQLLNISPQQYQKYESGKNKIPVHSLYRFCNFTGIDVGYLLNPVTTSE